MLLKGEDIINTFKKAYMTVVIIVMFVLIFFTSMNQRRLHNLKIELNCTREQTEGMQKNIEKAQTMIAEQSQLIKDKTEENATLTQQLQEQSLKVEELENEITELKRPRGSTGASRGVGVAEGRYLGEFTATAYDDSPESQGKWVGQTATGVKPQVGVIAVDPKVIPLGTKLYVEGYGNCVAGDVGGDIKNNRIDVFFDTKQECKDWGRRKVKVYVR